MTIGSCREIIKYLCITAGVWFGLRTITWCEFLPQKARVRDRGKLRRNAKTRCCQSRRAGNGAELARPVRVFAVR